MCYSPEVALSFLPYETSVLGKLTTYQAEMERERRTETEGDRDREIGHREDKKKIIILHPNMQMESHHFYHV